MSEKKRPGEGGIAKTDLHFIWIADCSYSMQGNKIEALNQAIKEAIPEMKTVAFNNNTIVLVRAIKFSDIAEWHIPTPIPIETFTWSDLTIGGTTAMGHAFKLVAEAMEKLENEKAKGYPPVLALISDGQPTDNYKNNLNKLLQTQWGKRAVKISIAIGDDADENILREFMGNSEYQLLTAQNSTELAQRIKFISTEVLKSVSSDKSNNLDKDEVDPPQDVW